MADDRRVELSFKYAFSWHRSYPALLPDLSDVLQSTAKAFPVQRLGLRDWHCHFCHFASLHHSVPSSLLSRSRSSLSSLLCRIPEAINAGRYIRERPLNPGTTRNSPPTRPNLMIDHDHDRQHGPRTVYTLSEALLAVYPWPDYNVAGFLPSTATFNDIDGVNKWNLCWWCGNHIRYGFTMIVGSRGFQ